MQNKLQWHDIKHADKYDFNSLVSAHFQGRVSSAAFVFSNGQKTAGDCTDVWLYVSH